MPSQKIIQKYFDYMFVVSWKPKTDIASHEQDKMVKTLTKFDDKEKVNILQKQFVRVFKIEPNDEVPVLDKKTVVNNININNTDETVRK